MAGPYLVSCTKSLKCPSGDKVFVRHVILKKDNSSPHIQAREVKNSLMINQLDAEGRRQSVWDKLLTVDFSSYSEDEINGILSRGIRLDGSHYCFLGFSASQLKNKTCFLIKETGKQISERRAKFGNFTNTIPFADRVATVQHMFDPFEKSLQLPEGEFKFQHNPSNTMPSGFLSPELANSIKTKCNLAEEPSVVQVICPGFSGNLVLSNEICSRTTEDSRPSNRIKALFKIPDAAYNCGNSLTMGIVDCAKPYQVGYLDVFSVMFLEERGVTREDLLELQRYYHDVLEKLGNADLTHTKYFLQLTGREELLRSIESVITDDTKAKISRIKEDEIKSMGNDTNQELRVFVSKSRQVFGIEDPYKDQHNALNSDECVFFPSLNCMDDQEKELFDSAQQVLVIPQPCYRSTDIRLLTLVRDKGEYEDLKDCIVLPSQPEAQAVVNKYFVSWDRNLMAQKSDSYLEPIANALHGFCSQMLKVFLPCSREMQPPTRHRFKGFEEIQTTEKDPKTASKLLENGSFQDQLKKYFATYKSSDDLVSSAKAHFEGFAALRGPSCSECKKLAEYLSPSFDWRVKRDEVKNYLEKLDRKKSEKPSSNAEGTQNSATQSSTPQPVWSEMMEISREFIAENT